MVKGVRTPYVLADPPCVRLPKIVRGDAAARAVIGPLTKTPTQEPLKVQDYVDASAGSSGWKLVLGNLFVVLKDYFTYFKRVKRSIFHSWLLCVNVSANVTSASLTGHFGVAEADDALGGQRHVEHQGLGAAVGVLKHHLPAPLGPPAASRAGLGTLSRQLGGAPHTLPADPTQRGTRPGSVSQSAQGCGRPESTADR